MISRNPRIVALLVITFLIASAFLWGAVQDHPPREGQPAYCVQNHKLPEFRCKCVEHDHGKG